MKKKMFFGIGIGFVVVVLAVVLILAFFLGNVVKKALNTVGPKVTQTAFSVDSVTVRPLMGYLYLNHFVLGNPEEYLAKSADCLNVGKTTVSVELASALSDKIAVKNVEVHDLVVNFEGNPLGANNLKKILENVKAFTGGEKPAGTNTPAKPAEKKPGKKLEVDNFVITGAKVNFNGMTLPLPDIHLTNLGTGPDGITIAELFQDVLSEISVASVKAAGSSVGAAGKAVGNEATKAAKSIGNLFKK